MNILTYLIFALTCATIIVMMVTHNKTPTDLTLVVDARNNITLSELVACFANGVGVHRRGSVYRGSSYLNMYIALKPPCRMVEFTFQIEYFLFNYTARLAGFKMSNDDYFTYIRRNESVMYELYRKHAYITETILF